MEAFSKYIIYLDYLPTLIAFFAVFYCWKDIGARWFLTLLLTVGFIDNYSVQYSINWKTHYYGWTILINLLFFIPSFYRQIIAQKIYDSTGSNFFFEASKLKFSQHEAALLLICFISTIAHTISYVEILMYKYFIIDIPYFKLFVLDKLQILLHIFSSLAVLSFTLKTKGPNYETTRA